MDFLPLKSTPQSTMMMDGLWMDLWIEQNLEMLSHQKSMICFVSMHSIMHFKITVGKRLYGIMDLH